MGGCGSGCGCCLSDGLDGFSAWTSTKGSNSDSWHKFACISASPLVLMKRGNEETRKRGKDILDDLGFHFAKQCSRQTWARENGCLCNGLERI
jgi:hypothetical protein